MQKEAVFTMKLEPELREQFMAAAEASHRPASQIVRDMMREFIRRQQEAREYDAFLGNKVSPAHDSARADIGRSNEEVEAKFAARRAEVLRSGDA
jgi:hypothetical protein